MIKFTEFETLSSTGEPLVHVLHDNFEKLAGYRSDVQKFIDGLEKKAEKTYVLVNAMTSGDFYGPNLNGDYFPDMQLDKYHKSFEKHAYAYRHHQNKDPKASSGKVVFASHNPEMHRVELVIELDDNRASDILEKLSNGEFPPVSMGTRTPSDRCSICNHRSKNVREYCDHLKYAMRHTYNDGRRVYAINDDRLTFFDISFIRIPADKTAGVMAKVAGVEKRKRVIPAALIGEEWLKESGLKESALTKEIPAVVESFGDDPLQLILKSQKKIPLERLDKIAEKYSLKDILSTFFSLKIMPRPEEFERIILIKMNRKSASDQALKQKRILMDLGEDPLIPIDITYDGFNKEMAADIKDLIPELSLTKPLVIKRILIKRAEAANSKDERSFLQRLFVSGGPKAPRPSEYSPVKNPLIPLTIAAGIGSLYRGFASRLTALVPKNLAGMDKFLWAHPEFIPLLVGATALGTILTQKSLFKEAGVFDKAPSLAGRLLVTVPSSYIYSGHLENKLKKGRKISTFEDLIRQHPFLTSLAATAGIGVGWRNLKKIKEGIQKTGAFEHLTYNLKPEKLDQLYNDVVGIN